MTHELELPLAELHSVREPLLEAIRRHETSVHGGAVCHGFRIGVLAWLAHLLKASPCDFNSAFEDLLQEHYHTCREACCGGPAGA